MMQPEQMRDSGWRRQKKMPAVYPSQYRYYIGAIGIGLGCGISWTLSMTTTGVQRHIISKPHAIMLLYSVVVLCFAAQTWMLYRWDRRLKADRAAIEKQYLELGMPSPWTKPKN